AALFYEVDYRRSELNDQIRRAMSRTPHTLQAKVNKALRLVSRLRRVLNLRYDPDTVVKRRREDDKLRTQQLIQNHVDLIVELSGGVTQPNDRAEADVLRLVISERFVRLNDLIARQIDDAYRLSDEDMAFVREVEDIYVTLAARFYRNNLVDILRDRVFTLKDPNQYKATLAEITAARVPATTQNPAEFNYEDLREHLDGQVNHLQEMLPDTKVIGRVKSAYSAHDKTSESRKGKVNAKYDSIEKLNDLLAITIIVENNDKSAIWKVIGELLEGFGDFHSIPGEANPDRKADDNVHTLFVGREDGLVYEIFIQTRQRYDVQRFGGDTGAGKLAHWQYDVFRKTGQKVTSIPVSLTGDLDQDVDLVYHALRNIGIMHVQVRVGDHKQFVDIKELPLGSTGADYVMHTVRGGLAGDYIGVEVFDQRSKAWRAISEDQKLIPGDLIRRRRSSTRPALGGNATMQREVIESSASLRTKIRVMTLDAKAKTEAITQGLKALEALGIP
ncbi:MAG: hypothetical protein K8I00_05490, partial [Candidatus Omnitrophica bacterium]|nr:hypothetical protein [Candidatus Omnitrophota bacterium]